MKEPERLQGLASRFKPTEELLAEVAAAAKPGLEWCVLRGGYFMNNLALMFGAALKGGAPAIAFPRVTCAPVDTRDIGDAAAALCPLLRCACCDAVPYAVPAATLLLRCARY